MILINGEALVIYKVEWIFKQTRTLENSELLFERCFPNSLKCKPDKTFKVVRLTFLENLFLKIFEQSS